MYGELDVAGSDHRRSQRIPASGIPVGRLNLSIYYRFLRSGLNPPCIHKILSSITAATGK